MKWHPSLNAAAAITYILIVALFMRFIESVRHDTPDTFVDAMGILSLLVCSAAVMGFLFFYQPIRLLIEKQPKEAVTYFLKTLGIFSIITIDILTVVSLQ